VHDFPAIMAKYDEYIEHSKSSSGDGEEVHRRQTVYALPRREKCQ
jgi:hypothetical protein